MLYSTYLGGASIEEVHALRVDAAGNAYVTGATGSADFPTTAGAAQTTHGGNQDVFVSKLNAAGSALTYSTYLGGSESEPSSSRLGGFEIDAAGNAYVYGDTESSNFPTSAGAPQVTRGNANPGQYDEDVFLTRINATGTAFSFSTYHGGSAIDATDDVGEEGRLFAIDGSGIAWIAGSTESADFPTTAGAFDTTFNGPATAPPGGGDAFIARYDTDAGTRSYSTLLGGTSDEFAGTGRRPLRQCLSGRPQRLQQFPDDGRRARIPATTAATAMWSLPSSTHRAARWCMPRSWAAPRKKLHQPEPGCHGHGVRRGLYAVDQFLRERRRGRHHAQWGRQRWFHCASQCHRLVLPVFHVRG